MSNIEFITPSPIRVERFLKRYYFLNNMYEIPRGIDTPIDIRVPTTEHAYQMAKFIDDEPRFVVAKAPTGLIAKTVALELLEEGWKKRDDWDEYKLEAMQGYNHQKFFENPTLSKKLIKTGDLELVEGNHHGDRFWGVDPPRSNNGLNNLGKILMHIRDDLISAL